MKKGETTKPCPGCGQAGLRDANAVCWHCTRLLQEAREARARQEADTTTITCDVPDRFPWYHVPTASHSHQGLSALEERLRFLMRTLVHAIGTPAVTNGVVYPDGREKFFTWPKGRRYEYSSYDHRLRFAPEVRAAFDELDTTIQTIIEESYATGKRDGGNLLLAMASGDITVPEFNRRTTGEKG